MVIEEGVCRMCVYGYIVTYRYMYSLMATYRVSVVAVLLLLLLSFDLIKIDGK